MVMLSVPHVVWTADEAAFVAVLLPVEPGALHALTMKAPAAARATKAVLFLAK
jgi:hypothetical protein